MVEALIQAWGCDGWEIDRQLLGTLRYVAKQMPLPIESDTSGLPGCAEEDEGRTSICRLVRVSES